MYNKLEIEFVLFYLRRELEHVDRAIVDLERKARKAHSHAVGPAKRPGSRALVDGRRDWTHHRLRAS
jgi:hypothetical protein